MILDLAKAVPIETEIARRGIRLTGNRSERVGPCPICGGRDRFSINTMKGLWHCRGCSRGGDVIAFVQHVDGVDFRTAVRTLAGTDAEGVSNKPIECAKPDTDTQNTERALKLWATSVPIAGTIVETYLHGRGLHDLPGDEVLRFHPACPFGDIRAACLVALYRDIGSNQPKAIARTAIDDTGAKIGRMTLGPIRSAAIKIDDDADIEQGLTVSEGLESGLAGRQLNFRPCWALGSAGAIRNFPVLAGIEALTILTDNDPPDANGRLAGQEAAAECVKRWRSVGCEVNIVLPKNPGSDIADYFGGQR
jgi:phage/plasmid primase-like uncharacterized protein